MRPNIAALFALGLATAVKTGALAVTPALAEDYQIGVINALTGPVGFIGVTLTNGSILAAEQLNASNYLGANKIKLLIEDTASDKTQAATLINKMGTDGKVLMVIGPTSSIESLAIAPAANDLKVPVYTAAMSSEIFAAGPWAFKGTPSAEAQIVPLAKYAADTLKVKKIALVFDRTNDSTVSQKRAFADYLQSHGVKIVSEDGVLGSDSDFNALATKIAAEDIDSIFISSQAPVAAGLIVQLKQAGLPEQVKLLGSAQLVVPQLIKLAGEAAEGLYSVGDFVPGGMNPEGQKFVEDYQKRFGVAADNYAAVGYTMLKVAAQAIKNAGPNPTRETVRDALLQIKDVPVVVGDGKYNIDGKRQVTYGGAMLMLKNGKFVGAEPK